MHWDYLLYGDLAALKEVLEVNILLRSLYYSRTLGAQFNYVFIIHSHIQSVLMRHDHIIMELLTFMQSGIDFLTVTDYVLGLNWGILIYTHLNIAPMCRHIFNEVHTVFIYLSFLYGQYWTFNCLCSFPFLFKNVITFAIIFTPNKS